MTLDTSKTTGSKVEAVEWNESAEGVNDFNDRKTDIDSTIANVNQDVQDTASPTFASPKVDSVKINTAATTTWLEGQIRHNDDVDIAVLDLDETDVSAPLVENTFKVKNTSGSTIDRFTVVRPTGATGGNPTIDLADASDFDKITPVGLIRSLSIANNAIGYVTTFGRIRNGDTSSWSEGDLLYLSTTPGELINVKPSYPNYPVRIGVVVSSHATEGSIIVDGDIVHDIDQDVSIGSTPSFNITDTNSKFVATTFDGSIDELGETKFINGYDLQDPDSMPDLAWVDGTRTFSCTVKSGESSFHFWCDGKKITKTTTQSVVIPDTTGLYYTYFDNSGVLQYISVSSVPDIAFYEYAITGMVRWNATQGAGGAANEMHGIRMSSATHKYNHDTFGARYASGFNPVGLVDGDTTFTQVNSGKFWDEDIEHSIAAMTTQPWLYRLGANGDWTSITADNEVGLKEGGDTYYSWNEWTGSTWQLTEGGVSTDYFITFAMATPNISGMGIIKVPGHNAYANVTDARNAIDSEKNSLDMGNLVSPELVFLYAIIVKRDGQLQELSDGSTYYDLRISRSGGGGTSTPAMEAADVPTNTTSFGGHLSTADTNVQLALDTLDDHTHTASQVTDFDTEVSNNSSVAANTSKVSYPGDADATELNILDGATLTTDELNYVDGVTSDIQTQLNAKGTMDDVSDDTTPTLGGDLDCSNKDLNNIALAEFNAEYDNGNSSTADTIDWNNGNMQKSTVTGNCTYTFTAPSGPARVQLKIIQDATGSRSVTFPSTVKFPGGTAPTLTTTASAVDIITFWYDGTNYNAIEVLDFK